MFNFDYARVATAAVGAIILSTVSVAAAVGPATAAGQASVQTASVSLQEIRAHG